MTQQQYKVLNKEEIGVRPLKFKNKSVRFEMHPPGNRYPDWFSYPHWHPDFAGKPGSKMHWPIVEPVVGIPAAAYNATKDDDCGCQ
jgi:hypothetical protein